MRTAGCEAVRVFRRIGCRACLQQCVPRPRAVTWRLFPDGERHLRPTYALAELYPPELLAESVHIAQRCTFVLGELRYQRTRNGQYCFAISRLNQDIKRPALAAGSIMSAVLRLIGLYESVVRAVMSIQPLIGCRPTCLISRACFLIARWTTAGTSGPEASARVSPPSQGNGAQRGPRLGTQPIFNQIRVGGAS